MICPSDRRLLEWHTEKLESFAHPHEENPDYKLVNSVTAKQRMELMYADTLERIRKHVTSLTKVPMVLKEENYEELSDNDFIPVSLPEEKIMVSLDEVLKIIREV